MRRVKKTAALAFVICLLLTLLTGCIKIELDISVRSDGKADIAMVYAMADAATDNGESAVTEEEIREYESEGWTAEPYSQDGYTGVLLKKQDVDLSEEELVDGSSGSIRKENDLYIIDLAMIPEEDQEDFAETAAWLKTSGGSFIVRLHLPVKPVTHNATGVSEDGKTLEWDLLEMDGRESIHVEFKAGAGAVLGSIGKVIGIAAAVALIAGIIFVASKSRAKNVPEPFFPAESGYGTPDIPEEVKPEGKPEEESL